MEVAPLLSPDVLDADRVQQRDAQGVAASITAKGVNEALDELLRLSSATRASTAVLRPLLLGDPLQHLCICEADHPLLPLQLRLLRLHQTASISTVDCEDAVTQLPHENGVQLVAHQD